MKLAKIKTSGLLTVIIFFIIIQVAFADEKQEKTLILPLKINSELNAEYPDTQAIFETYLKTSYPNLHFAVLSPKDSALQNVDFYEPSVLELNEILKTTDGDFIVWGNLNLRKTNTSVVNAGITYSILAVNSVGNIKIYSKKHNEVIYDKPIILSKSERHRSFEDSQHFKEIQTKLVNMIIENLAEILGNTLKTNCSGCFEQSEI